MLQPISPSNPLAKIFNKVPFIMQVVIGLIVGIILAAIYPNDTTVIPTLGVLFVSALKAIAPSSRVRIGFSSHCPSQQGC